MNQFRSKGMQHHARGQTRQPRGQQDCHPAEQTQILYHSKWFNIEKKRRRFFTRLQSKIRHSSSNFFLQFLLFFFTILCFCLSRFLSLSNAAISITKSASISIFRFQISIEVILLISNFTIFEGKNLIL